jgi:hypothetical protein
MATLTLAAAPAVFAQSAPTVIRIGSPDLGTAGKPFPGGNPLAVAKANGWLEEEFAKDNIKLEWTFFRGAGPAVNEALSGKQLDVVFLGDLASVIGFDVAVDARERANLRHKHADVFELLRAQWQRWNEGFLPITDEVFTHGVTPDIQADRYAPTSPTRLQSAG